MHFHSYLIRDVCVAQKVNEIIMKIAKYRSQNAMTKIKGSYYKMCKFLIVTIIIIMIKC